MAQSEQHASRTDPQQDQGCPALWSGIAKQLHGAHQAHHSNRCRKEAGKVKGTSLRFADIGNNSQRQRDGDQSQRNINKENPSNIEVFEAISSSRFFSYEMFDVLFNENSDGIANEFKQYLSNKSNTNKKNVFVKNMESFLLYDEKRQSIIKSICMEEILLNMIEIK